MPGYGLSLSHTCNSCSTCQDMASPSHTPVTPVAHTRIWPVVWFFRNGIVCFRNFRELCVRVRETHGNLGHACMKRMDRTIYGRCASDRPGVVRPGSRSGKSLPRNPPVTRRQGFARPALVRNNMLNDGFAQLGGLPPPQPPGVPPAVGGGSAPPCDTAAMLARPAVRDDTLKPNP